MTSGVEADSARTNYAYPGYANEKRLGEPSVPNLVGDPVELCRFIGSHTNRMHAASVEWRRIAAKLRSQYPDPGDLRTAMRQDIRLQDANDARRVHGELAQTYALAYLALYGAPPPE